MSISDTLTAVPSHKQLRQRALAAAGLLVVALLLTLLPLRLALLGSVAIFGGLLALCQPWLMWVALAVAIPFASGIRFGFVSFTDLVLALAVWIWFVHGARRRTLRLHTTWLPLLLALYAGFLLLLATGAADLGEAAAEVIKWSEVFLAVLLVREVCTAEQIRWLVAGLLLGGALQGLLGLYQFVFQIGPPWFVIFDRFMRASGSFRQPNPYAGYLGLCLPVAVSLTLWAWQHVRQNPLAFLFYSGTTAAIGIGLLASWSRGGWLGAVAGVGIVLLFYSWQMRLMILSAAVAAFSTVLLGLLRPDMLPASILLRLQGIPALFGLGNLEQVLQEPLTDQNFALVERVAHWVVALRIWEQAPWLGAGPGAYAAIYPSIIRGQPFLMRWEDPLGHAHNIYLNLLAETGLVGLLVYVGMWLSILWWLIRLYATLPPGSWGRALALGVIGVVGHLSIHNFFDNLFVHGMYLHIGLWLAALYAAYTCKPSISSEQTC